MSSSKNTYLAFGVLLLAGICGWFLMQEAIEKKVVKKESPPVLKVTPSPSPIPDSNLGKRAPSPKQSLEDLISAPNERLVRFSSEDAYRRALERLKNSGLSNLGQLDRLRAVRIGFNDLNDLNDLLGDEGEQFRNFYSRIPTFPDVADQPNAIPFGNTLLEFLGITEDNSAWGEGVAMAIVDTGVSPHITLTNVRPQINFVELPNGVEQHGHGTAVASLAGGQDPRLRGIAPGTDIQPYRVTDENGVATDFDILQAYEDAAQRGIPFIVTALGGYGFNPLMQESIDNLVAQGSVIIASSGNDGLDNLAYPARYNGVFSIGAIDANGTLMNFSNRGESLDFVAPGNGVQAAWPGDRVIDFTGTSAGPSIAAAIAAAIMTESETPLTAQEAMQVAIDHLNEGGPAGWDPGYGNGIFDAARAIRRDTTNVEDLAVASQHYLTAEENNGVPILQVNVQNQGTATSNGASLDIRTGAFSTSFQVNRLNPGEVRTFQIPTGQAELQQNGFFDVTSTVQSPTSQTNDVEPNNNVRRDRIEDENFEPQ